MRRQASRIASRRPTVRPSSPDLGAATALSGACSDRPIDRSKSKAKQTKQSKAMQCNAYQSKAKQNKSKQIEEKKRLRETSRQAALLRVPPQHFERPSVHPEPRRGALLHAAPGNPPKLLASFSPAARGTRRPRLDRRQAVSRPAWRSRSWRSWAPEAAERESSGREGCMNQGKKDSPWSTVQQWRQRAAACDAAAWAFCLSQPAAGVCAGAKRRESRHASSKGTRTAVCLCGEERRERSLRTERRKEREKERKKERKEERTPIVAISILSFFLFLFLFFFFFFFFLSFFLSLHRSIDRLEEQRWRSLSGQRVTAAVQRRGSNRHRPDSICTSAAVLFLASGRPPAQTRSRSGEGGVEEAGLR